MLIHILFTNKYSFDPFLNHLYVFHSKLTIMTESNFIYYILSLWST